MLPPIDLDRYPLHRPDTDAYRTLVEKCRADLAREGMFNLEGFMLPEAIDKTLQDAAPRLNPQEAFVHARTHNIYFRDVPELPRNHPALREVETRNLNRSIGQTH